MSGAGILSVTSISMNEKFILAGLSNGNVSLFDRQGIEKHRLVAGGGFVHSTSIYGSQLLATAERTCTAESFAALVSHSLPIFHRNAGIKASRGPALIPLWQGTISLVPRCDWPRWLPANATKRLWIKRRRVPAFCGLCLGHQVR